MFKTFTLYFMLYFLDILCVVKSSVHTLDTAVRQTGI